MNQEFPSTNQHGLTHVRRNILLGEGGQDFIDRCLADVYQHAGVREPPYCLDLVPLCSRDDTAQRLSTIISLQHFPVRHRRHPLVVEFEPSGMPVWFDESEIMSTVEITGVHKDTMKPVLPGFGPVSSLIEEVVKINFQGELEAVVDLREGQNQTNNFPGRK